MHDVIIGIIFLAMLLLPCLAAFRSDSAESKHDGSLNPLAGSPLAGSFAANQKLR